MKIRPIFTFVIFFSILNVKAQLNLPLKFLSDEVKWAELTWIEGNRNQDQWFENRVAPIIVGDTMYVFMNYRGVFDNNASLNHCGYSIKKINVKTGQKYWETQRLYKEFLKRKALSQPRLNGNTLEVTLYDEAQHPLIGAGTEWTYCYPARITLDLKSGNIIDSSNVNRSDSTIYRLRSIAGSPESGQDGLYNSKIYKTNDGYQQTYFDGSKFLITYVNNNGQLLNIDTTRLDFKYNFRNHRYFQLNPHTHSSFEVSQSENWKNREILYRQYDLELNIIKTVDITDYLLDSTYTVSLLHYSNGYFILATAYEDFETGTGYINYSMFDTEGVFIDRLNYQLNKGIDDEIKYGYLLPMADVVNKRILLTHSRQNSLSENTYFEIYASEGDTVQRLKRIEVEGIQDHFRIDYATMMENGDILLYIRQFAWNVGLSKYMSWIMLNGQKMNIISDTKDVSSTQNTLKLYPNPTNGLVNIEGLDHTAKIKVFNINGQLVKSILNVQGQIDINNLKSGIYIIEIDVDNAKQRYKIVKTE